MTDEQTEELIIDAERTNTFAKAVLTAIEQVCREADEETTLLEVVYGMDVATKCFKEAVLKYNKQEDGEEE